MIVPETRWRCTQCGQDFKESELEGPGLITIKGTRIPWPKNHTVNVARGGTDGTIGMYMDTDLCGPIEEVEVGVQEQFVEWLETMNGGSR